MTRNTVAKPVEASNASTARKPRLFYLDLVRALAVILIIITHFNNPFMGNHPIFMYEPFGIYVGSLGVSLFLIISGAALMYGYGDKEHLDIKKFYWKRCKAIYPMFWIAFIVANVLLLLRYQGNMYANVPAYRIIYSFLGVDGLLSTTGMLTFYTLGEWFLGFIILFYVVFPLLRYGVKNYPVHTAIFIAALYTLSLIFPVNVLNLPSATLLWVRLPELVFGMYFTKYMRNVNAWVAAACGVFLIVQELNPLVHDDLGTTIVGIAAFLVIVFFSQWLNQKAVQTPVKIIAKYSYPIFLVHHQVIMQVFSVMDLTRLSMSGAYLVFFVDLVIIMIGACILDRITSMVMEFMQRVRK